MDDGVHTDRARAESFGSIAGSYDRFRPSYPDQLFDDLAALELRTALDVGCGTGKAAVPLIRRKLTVLGVEIDPRMAAVARRHRVPVEVSSFEDWDDRGRTFDLVVSGQAWHWLDPYRAARKAAHVLRAHGRIALFWNFGELDRAVQDAFDDVYLAHAPQLLRSVVAGRGRRLHRPYAEELARHGRFSGVHERTYEWEQRYLRDEWIALAGTHSDHLQLDPDRRGALLNGLADALDRRGGELTVHYSTYTVLARRTG